MSAIYYDQESIIKAYQCKTIVTFDNTPESKILDARHIVWNSYGTSYRRKQIIAADCEFAHATLI